ncbi:rRNA maturation RNase YbeY [Stratiformator vulcanicus]|uniref:Endoribonuclease YbeY n=1 Tax=Stratiformator vulcanicus TaxID=2527980 RepID=A0A517R6I2_9PLAN|nr:rRNA maturation RNase YbeY [Stratiformator vulcanicus]QDT39506.1 Endoribonuclease YbeY [Stratiformator vulcanicus]
MSEITAESDPQFLIEFAINCETVACDESSLRTIAIDVLRQEGIAEAEISVAIVGHSDMRRMNREYLDHDFDTDVLSFRLDDNEPGDGSLEGQLVIDAETAAEAAAEFRWSGREELILYLIHGLLHLAGYDDRTDEDRNSMRIRETALLSRHGIERSRDLTSSDSPSVRSAESERTR